ncbi:MAG: DUF3578 domain-containing protein [Methylotenera sp.]
MTIREALLAIGEGYTAAQGQEFEGHALGGYIRKTAPRAIAALLGDPQLKVKGGCGISGNWAVIPWIGVFDTAVTEGAQRGYYIVYLFSADMSRVYLSMNQGTTEARWETSSDAESRELLRTQAKRMREALKGKAEIPPTLAIELESDRFYAKGYEAGHAFGYAYQIEALPGEDQLQADLRELLRLYRLLIKAGGGAVLSEDEAAEVGLSDAKIDERRNYVAHRKLERNPKAAEKAKKALGCQCQACGLDFGKLYGESAKGYIEAHHLKPISEIPDGETVSLDPKKDFAVLCANCHRAIHKKGAPQTIQEFKQQPGVMQLARFYSEGIE